MTEMILQAKTLPTPLLKLIHTKNVIIRELDGEIHLIPIEEPVAQQSTMPILGMYTDGKLTVEGHLKRNREEMALER